MTGERRWWADVLTGGKGEIVTERVPKGERYVLLPSRDDPRVVVDAECPSAVIDAVSRALVRRSVPRPLRSVASLASPMARALAPAWYVLGTGREPTLREFLSEILGTEVRLSIAVGPPRPNRKPVVRCHAGGELVAVAKLGPEVHTARMVANEGDWLERFERRPLPGASTARPLHRGRYGESEVLVMSVLPVADARPTPLSDMPGEVLAELGGRYPEATGLAATSYFQDLSSRLDPFADRRVAAALDSVRDDPAFDEVACSLWHGDWSPWNVARSGTGGWSVWDWERTIGGVPRGMDELHLRYQYGDGLEAGVAALEANGSPVAHSPLIARVYLLEVVARSVEAGSPVGRHCTTALSELASVGAASGAARGRGIE